MMIHVKTFNEFHLGDNIFHLDYLKKIIDNNPEYRFTHYCNTDYHIQLNSMLKGYENAIILNTLQSRPQDAINCWIGDGRWYHDKLQSSRLPFFYDSMYLEWYKFLEKKYSLPNPMMTSNDFLLKLDGMDSYDITTTYDVLVINSVALSGQYVYEPELFHKFCEMMSKAGLRVITTNKIEGYECTRDYGYDISAIAKISNRCKYILAVHTGPIALCINKLTLDNVVFFHILDNHHSYSYEVCTWSENLTGVEFNF